LNDETLNEEELAQMDAYYQQCMDDIKHYQYVEKKNRMQKK